MAGRTMMSLVAVGVLSGLAVSSESALALQGCEQLRRDCADYCRYAAPMGDHRDCVRECRERVKQCHGGGMEPDFGAPGAGYPGGFGPSSRRDRGSESDFPGMPGPGGAYSERGGYPGGGYGGPPAGPGYGPPGYPGAPGYGQPPAAAPAQAGQAPEAPAPGEAVAPPQAPAPQAPAYPAGPAYPGYGGYPPPAGYGGYGYPPGGGYGYPPGGGYGPYQGR